MIFGAGAVRPAFAPPAVPPTVRHAASSACAAVPTERQPRWSRQPRLPRRMQRHRGSEGRAKARHKEDGGTTRRAMMRGVEHALSPRQKTNFRVQAAERGPQAARPPARDCLADSPSDCSARRLLHPTARRDFRQPPSGKPSQTKKSPDIQRCRGFFLIFCKARSTAAPQ